MGVISCMRASVGCIHAHVLKLSSSIQCAVYRWDAVNLHLSPVNFSPPLLAQPRHIAHVRAALRTASHIRRQRSDSVTSPECDRRIGRETRSARQREWCKLTNYELREQRKSGECEMNDRDWSEMPAPLRLMPFDRARRVPPSLRVNTLRSFKPPRANRRSIAELS